MGNFCGTKQVDCHWTLEVWCATMYPEKSRAITRNQEGRGHWCPLYHRAECLHAFKASPFKGTIQCLLTVWSGYRVLLVRNEAGPS